MSAYAYTEDELVEQTVIGLFAERRWQVPGRHPVPALPANRVKRHCSVARPST